MTVRNGRTALAWRRSAACAACAAACLCALSLIGGCRRGEPASRRDETSVRALAARLRAGDERERIDAANALRNLSAGAADALPQLTGALHDPSPLVRMVAVGALGELGESAAAPLSRALAADADEKVRGAAAMALGALGPRRAPGGLTSLVRALDDPSEIVRAKAASAMHRFGPGARVALARAADDRSRLVRDTAKVALARIDAESGGGSRSGEAAALAEQLEILRDGAAYPRAIAAQTIGRFSRPTALQALPVLTAALTDKDEMVRVAAAGAIRACGAAGAPALLIALRDRSVSVRTVAAEGLGRLREAAALAGAVPALTDALRDADVGVRITAVEALARIGSEEALDALGAATKDSDWFVRARAQKAIERLGSAPRAAAAQ